MSKRWFQDNRISVLEWAGNGPDFNPIENVGNHLKKIVQQKERRNKIQLIEAIVQSWYYIITAYAYLVLHYNVIYRNKY